jgi:hypothetical protein
VNRKRCTASSTTNERVFSTFLCRSTTAIHKSPAQDRTVTISASSLVVYFRGPLLDQSSAHPVSCLLVLWPDRLCGDETHARPTYRFTDRFRIVGVVLICT